MAKSSINGRVSTGAYTWTQRICVGVVIPVLDLRYPCLFEMHSIIGCHILKNMAQKRPETPDVIVPSGKHVHMEHHHVLWLHQQTK